MDGKNVVIAFGIANEYARHRDDQRRYHRHSGTAYHLMEA